MSNYSPDDLTPDKAIQLIDELESVLTWAEWWFCGKDDEMADHINANTRTDISHILTRMHQLNKRREHQ